MTDLGLDGRSFDGSVFGVDEVGSPGIRFRRHDWLRTFERRLPRGASADIAVRTTTIPPEQATDWRVVNGVTYSMVLAGDPTVHWRDGERTQASAGSAFTLDIGRVHRIENRSQELAVVLLTLYVTAPDRDHVVAVVPESADWPGRGHPIGYNQ